MKTRMAIALSLTLLATLSLGAQSARTKTVESSDGSVRVTIPADWETQDLNDAAEIQFGNEEQGAYFIVLVERKEDLFGWNIQRHSFVTIGQLLSDVSLPKITGPKSLKVGEWPAIQYEIRGAASGANIVYLHTTIETPELFAQVLAWTIPSQESANRKALESAILSLRPVD